ncbi:MAG: hypothetical protein ACK50R_05535 [Planctomycetota bacterium]
MSHRIDKTIGDSGKASANKCSLEGILTTLGRIGFERSVKRSYRL